MPQAREIAEIEVNGQRYADWESMSVTRSGQDLFSRFAFTAASPIESAPNWAGMKLAIGDAAKIYLAGRLVIDGKIRTRQPAYDDKQHGLQIAGSSLSATIARATVEAKPGEFKNYSLEQIANSALKPFGVKFYLKGDTPGAEKPFERVNVQVGETVFALIDRLCRMRNVYLFDDPNGNIVGYRLGKGAQSIADLEEGRNIKSASAVFNYEGAFSMVEAKGQNTGNNERFGDDSRDVSAQVTNSAVKDHAPLVIMAEMPGDQNDMKMRAQRENGENIATQINVNVTVQGWHKDDGSLWLEKIGDVVTVYSPMLFTNDRMSLAIQEVTSGQGPGGTVSTLGLVLPERFNGGGQIEGTPNIPGFTGA
ncbi:phage baseplate assembly protein [Methylobacterium soli]|uniref:Mu-like prophage tail protein gpP n=1 Tax=Methylobacterium soli TaxID=553447 RepID=A0A6L3SZ56_9HYPH|nr:hypothetical protein [Methylobacterium soli]KAB1079413.1 hypothetical protein F6X53_11460 [Methylobacterium soli]GJE45372.1 hypothetical protein AEGHOMDF_4566 [Methylobacterium soli]